MGEEVIILITNHVMCEHPLAFLVPAPGWWDGGRRLADGEVGLGHMDSR